MAMKILVTKTGWVDIYEDDYNKGEGDFVNQWDVDVRGEYDSVEELLKAIQNKTYLFENGNLQNCLFIDGDLLLDDEVNVNNETPTDAEIEDWKNGETMLYAARLRLPLEVVSDKHAMTAEEAEQFGLEIA